MPRIISPPRTEFHRLRTELTAGERQVLEFFDCQLDEEWEIYVQPHLNGLRPDFVLLHPRVGIAVFEVKDWNLAAMSYYVRGTGDSLALWAENREGRRFRVRDNPVEKVVQY